MDVRESEVCWENEDDISWLTQQPRLEPNVASFDLGHRYLEEDIDVGNCISLEEEQSSQKGRILYDNVVAEDITSDENIDSM